MNEYGNVLKRVKEYRNDSRWSQDQISEKMGMTQDRYSDIENGHTKISYQDMLAFDGLGLSVNRLVSGKEYGNCDLFDEDIPALDWTKYHDGKEIFLKMTAELMLYFLKKKSDDTKKPETIQLLELTVKFWDEFSMVRIVRERLNYSQDQMATELGIAIRTLRKLERENSFPDAELLHQLYQMSHYEPVLFTEVPDRKFMIVQQAWKLLSKEQHQKMTEFLQHLQECVR